MLTTDEIEQLRQSSDLFEGFLAEELVALTSLATVRRVERGEVVCREGGTTVSLFVVISGKMRVSRQVGEETVPLAALKAGKAFGEMSVLTGGPRTADLTAAKDGVVLEISAEDLESLIRARPEVSAKLWRNVAVVLARRLAKTNDLVAEYVQINQRLIDDPEFLRFYQQL